MGLSPDAIYSAVCSDVGHYVQDFEPEYRPDSKSKYLNFESNLGVKTFASDYLIRSIIRKWIPKDTTEADKAALESFTAANNSCKSWVFSPEDVEDQLLLGETKRILDSFFHPGGEFLIQSYFDLLRSARPGPGVNVGSLGTCYYSKYFASPLSSTSEYLYDEYRAYADWIPLLSEAECQRYEKFGSPRIVSGSRCSFVPKTNSTSRMICIEPSLNMYFQLGLASILEERLKSFFGIDLATQPLLNMRLARQGSIDGSFATIDLKSASDSISLRLCEMLLPKWFFELLLHLRSHTTLINGVQVPLSMMSTMGNGFTFPLQTLIFSAVVLATRNISDTSRNSQWSVFGDDIVCDTSLYDRLCHNLRLLNFTVNASKSFSQGPFRESCGADFFLGNPVRPVFIRKLDTPQDIVVAVNQLNEWSSYTGIALCNTVELLLDHLDKKYFLPVPFDSNNDSGIRVPLGLFGSKFDRNGSYVYKTWERRATKLLVTEGAIRGVGRLGNLFFNPPGLYASFLFGELVNYTISIRHDRWLYRSRLRHSPYWDYAPPGRLTNGTTIQWQQWETAVCINLHKSLAKAKPRA